MLLLFIALPQEALPIIEKYQLKKNGSVYENKQMKLIITGCGPFSSCTMVERFGSKGDIFVNIGVCGHKDAEIGKIFLVGKVSMCDAIEYPRISFRTKIPIATLSTVLSPTEIYPSNDLIDMEGFGFFKAALNFTNREQIQLIKIVSDNQTHPFDKNNTSSLVQRNLETIDKILLSLKVKEELDLSCFFQKWHFTQTQQSILKEQMHSRDCGKIFVSLKHLSSAEEVLNVLKEKRILSFG